MMQAVLSNAAHDGGFFSVQFLQLLYAGTAAVGVHIVVTANGSQVREVCDNGGFLTAEGQVDEVFHVGQIQLLGHGLKRGSIADLQRFHQLDTFVELFSGNGERDSRNTVFRLIDGGGGTVTRYGVVYDNGMKMDQSYDGKHFPAYLYEPPMLMVALTSNQEPEDTKNITWLYLPAAKGQIERAMARSGIADPEDMCFRFAESMFPDEVDAALDFRYEGIFELNELAQAVDKLSMDDRKKLGAVVAMAEPEYAMQIRHLAENLDQFEFAPGVHTPAEYGKFMIQESGHFEYDPNLDEFYDYEKYGLQRMEQQSGMFTDRGYISYHGTMSLEELMMEDPAEQYQKEQGFQMGGMA